MEPPFGSALAEDGAGTRISIEVRAGNLKRYSRTADRTKVLVVVVVVVAKCTDMVQVELKPVRYVKPA
jgi:hypothetical protein